MSYINPGFVNTQTMKRAIVKAIRLHLHLILERDVQIVREHDKLYITLGPRVDALSQYFIVTLNVRIVSQNELRDNVQRLSAKRPAATKPEPPAEPTR